MIAALAVVVTEKPVLYSAPRIVPASRAWLRSFLQDHPSNSAMLLILNAGTLDDPTSVTPQLEIYCERALPWVHLSGEMRRFPKMPE